MQLLYFFMPSVLYLGPTLFQSAGDTTIDARTHLLPNLQSEDIEPYERNFDLSFFEAYNTFIMKNPDVITLFSS